MEKEVDKKRDEFIMGEFNRLGEKVFAENSRLLSRIEELEK